MNKKGINNIVLKKGKMKMKITLEPKVRAYIQKMFQYQKVQIKVHTVEVIRERQEKLGVMEFYPKEFPDHIGKVQIKSEITGKRERVCVQKMLDDTEYYFHPSFCFMYKEGEITEIINLNKHFRKVRDIEGYYRKHIVVENRYMKLMGYSYSTERTGKTPNDGITENEIYYMKQRAKKAYNEKVRGLHLKRREKQREHIFKEVYDSLQ